jgi:hypothetical protein
MAIPTVKNAFHHSNIKSMLAPIVLLLYFNERLAIYTGTTVFNRVTALFWYVYATLLAVHKRCTGRVCFFALN